MLQEKEAERVRKQNLFKLIGPHNSPHEVFRIISKLIITPSILVELPDKVVQNQFSEKCMSSIVQEKFINSQISSNQWYNFFKTINIINSYNFNPIA
jgi:hypothetical protein